MERVGDFPRSPSGDTFWTAAQGGGAWVHGTRDRSLGWTKGEFEQEKAELRRSFRNLHRSPLKFLHICRQHSGGLAGTVTGEL